MQVAPDQIHQTTHEPPGRLLIAHFRSDTVSGAERSISDLMDHLHSDFTFTMLVPREGQLAEFYRQRGYDVWVREVQNFRRLYPGLHWLQSWLLSSAMKKRGIQAVLCNTFPAASRVGTACRLAHIPYAIYIREFITDRPINRKMLADANRVFVISQDLQKYVSQMTAPAQVMLTYNHINPEPITARVENHRANGNRLIPFSPEHPVVGIVGRITPFKQQDLFVQSAPLILAEVPEARFVVVGAAQGKDQEYEQRLKELTHQLQIEDKFAFLGHRTDSIEITSEFTVSCLTSTREPLGRVVLEANLIGCPVVATDAGGAAEIVADEITGLKFDATAPDAREQFARQVIRLLKDPAMRRRLADNARSKVFATFAGDRYVHTQADYIKSLIASNGSYTNNDRQSNPG